MVFIGNPVLWENDQTLHTFVNGVCSFRFLWCLEILFVSMNIVVVVNNVHDQKLLRKPRSLMEPVCCDGTTVLYALSSPRGEGRSLVPHKPAVSCKCSSSPWNEIPWFQNCAPLRSYPNTEMTMKVNPYLKKKGLLTWRRLAVNIDYLPEFLATTPSPNVISCIHLDLENALPPYTIGQACGVDMLIHSHPQWTEFGPNRALPFISWAKRMHNKNVGLWSWMWSNENGQLLIPEYFSY